MFGLDHWCSTQVPTNARGVQRDSGSCGTEANSPTHTHSPPATPLSALCSYYTEVFHVKFHSEIEFGCSNSKQNKTKINPCCLHILKSVAVPMSTCWWLRTPKACYSFLRCAPQVGGGAPLHLSPHQGSAGGAAAPRASVSGAGAKEGWRVGHQQLQASAWKLHLSGPLTFPRPNKGSISQGARRCHPVSCQGAES